MGAQSRGVDASLATGNHYGLAAKGMAAEGSSGHPPHRSCCTTGTLSIHGTVTRGCSPALPRPQPFPGSISPPQCMGSKQRPGTWQQGPRAGNGQSRQPQRVLDTRDH